MYFRIDLAFKPFFGNIQIIIHLQAQPELRRILEIAGQPERGVSGNTPFAKRDLVYPARQARSYLLPFLLNTPKNSAGVAGSISNDSGASPSRLSMNEIQPLEFMKCQRWHGSRS
jgi:hypothetical protein